MTSTNSKGNDEAQIREIIEGRVKAIAAKDVDAAMAPHAQDVVMFDVLNPLRYRGAATVRDRTSTWFSSFQGPIGYEVRDLSITTSESVAFCHYLYQVRGTTKDGKQIEMWVRATMCFHKIDGRWLVSHEHDSVPFDPATGRAALDLKP
jgi:ketosteroid isomerase-like protein